MDILPNYRVTEQIHEGKASVLYRGYRSGDGAPVVVKVPKGEFPSVKEIAKLRHEHAIMSDLTVPGVVRVHALEKCGHGLALVMEDMDGRSLAQHLGACRADLGMALRIGAAVAEALGAIHQRHVIHKDVKPHNILVRGEDAREVKLADFGIATRLSEESPRLESVQAIEGTLLYMSPEQTGRMNRALDYRTDLYSLGATLYEVLTGAPPFPSEDALELVHSHVAVAPRPPRRVAPEIPEVVSDIVMKLLAKAAEDRYQSARGLKEDLSECLARLDAGGRIEPFPLGRRDAPTELHVPRKLWGREAELAKLFSAVERVAGGAAELCLVSGHAGVGKSALINELPRMMATVRRPFLWAAGKFDEISRGTPHSGIALAIQDLVRQSLAEPEEVLGRRRDALQRAVGASGRVLIDLVPEVELLLGPLPPALELGLVETQNRFALLVQSFIRVFATAEQPLCLLFDDLQWADPASLRLLQIVLSDPASAHLLVLGGYRGEEVDGAHPLSVTSAALNEAGVRCQTIELQPLSADHVSEIVAGALRCDPARSAPLAELLCERTRGNPFFLGQLLLALHRDGLLTFDARLGAWVWDLPRVRGAALTDDVVALMSSRIQKLAPGVQHALMLAACIGHKFDLETLSIIHERPLAETARDLWEALREGLVLPLDPEYKFIDDASAPALTDVSYRFSHDRIQQAAYALIEDSDRRGAHLRVGRLLLQGKRELGDEALFQVLRHLNFAAPLITEPGERSRIARWNLAAGRRARAATAYQAAADHQRAAIELLGDAGWEEHFELLFDLHADRAECEYLAGAPEAAEPLLELLLARGRTDLERARALELRATLYLTTSRFSEAIRAGTAALALFGIQVPGDEDGLRAGVGAGLAEVAASLAGRSVRDLLDAPVMVDPAQRAAHRILSTMIQPGPLIGPTLFAFLNVVQVKLFLRHGHSDLSAYGYMTYGCMMALGFDRRAEARDFGELAIALHKKLENPGIECKLNELYGIYSHAFLPVRVSLGYLDRAYHAGLETGDLLYLSYSCFHAATIRFNLGDELGALRSAVDESLALARRARVAICTDGLTVLRQAIASLAGGTAGRLSLSDGAFDEVAFVESHRGPDVEFIACLYYMLKAQLSFLHEDHEGALSMAIHAHERAASAKGLYIATELSFYTCLILLALAPAPADDERERRSAMLARERASVEGWAASVPESFDHKRLLVQAEAARASGGDMEATLDLYDQAIEAAQAGGFPHHAALANELCARFLVARRRPKLARLYMTEAYYGYLHWGASAKVEQIAERHPELLLAAEPPPRIAPSSTITTSISVSVSGSDSGGAGAFDVMSVVRAAQAISGELLLERLLDRLLHIFAENAGAQRAVLLLSRGAELTEEAAVTMGPPPPPGAPPIRPGERSGVAMSVAQYVQRTRKPVVLGNAAADRRFAMDPHIAASQPRSVLCLPMVHQDRVTGVLYLENNVVHDAFPPAREELLRLLASHAATAIENALLYDRVRAMSQDLQRSNESLAQEVARQTEALSDANARLLQELAERERAEAGRAALQEQVILAQKARLAELSTPFIPITDRIMVMPLIGLMDAERAQQVLETALGGAQARQASVVIIDITGVTLVDASVATTLLRATSALRLLGTRVIITGIRAEVAQALVQQGIDLGAVVTRSTLQSGIAHALGRPRL